MPGISSLLCAPLIGCRLSKETSDVEKAKKKLRKIYRSPVQPNIAPKNPEEKKEILKLRMEGFRAYTEDNKAAEEHIKTQCKKEMQGWDEKSVAANMVPILEAEFEEWMTTFLSKTMSCYANIVCCKSMVSNSRYSEKVHDLKKDLKTDLKRLKSGLYRAAKVQCEMVFLILGSENAEKMCQACIEEVYLDDDYQPAGDILRALNSAGAIVHRGRMDIDYYVNNVNAIANQIH